MAIITNETTLALLGELGNTFTALRIDWTHEQTSQAKKKAFAADIHDQLARIQTTRMLVQNVIESCFSEGLNPNGVL